LETAEKLAHLASPDAQHAVISQPDASKGEALVLFTTDTALDRAALQQAAQQIGVPGLAVPKKIVPIMKLPLLGTGKTDYVTLSRMTEMA
jgi:acyl-[acyl-carrier-protein]-phospholipid O-acyltransferase/long-chain-fatty-acid--[acyl-carrier-protein] ligase